jgi:quinol monooxygenase YgiN
MSVIAIFDVQLRPETLEDGIAALQRVLADTAAFAGCVSVEVVQDRDDPAHIIAVEVWESLEADAAYREWRAGEGKPTEFAAFRVGPPRVTVGTTITP